MKPGQLYFNQRMDVETVTDFERSYANSGESARGSERVFVGRGCVLAAVAIHLVLTCVVTAGDTVKHVRNIYQL